MRSPISIKKDGQFDFDHLNPSKAPAWNLRSSLQLVGSGFPSIMAFAGLWAGNYFGECFWNCPRDVGLLLLQRLWEILKVFPGNKEMDGSEMTNCTNETKCDELLFVDLENPCRLVTISHFVKVGVSPDLQLWDVFGVPQSALSSQRRKFPIPL